MKMTKEMTSTGKQFKNSKALGLFILEMEPNLKMQAKKEAMLHYFDARMPKGENGTLFQPELFDHLSQYFPKFEKLFIVMNTKINEALKIADKSKTQAAALKTAEVKATPVLGRGLA
ncbi:MAG: hypothetical protein LBM38_02775 [Clostridiales bacterium]|jgi:hypothetical protein|nr:hypothetical protein [Clostridiales bacterium]